MEIYIRVTKAVSLAKVDRSTDPYVVVKFGAEEGKTTVKQNTLNPVWNEVIKLPTDDEEGELELQVFDKNYLGSNKLGIAAVNIKEKTGKVELKLRGPKQTKGKNTKDFGRLYIEWWCEIHENKFRADLAELMANRQLVVGPLMWLHELLIWKRPYQTMAVLSIIITVCLNGRLDLFILGVLIVTLIGTHYTFCRYGPDYYQAEPLSDRKDVNRRLYTATTALNKISDTLDSLWDIATFKDAQTSNNITRFLLAWIILELLGLFPPVSICIMVLVCATLFIYPLNYHFPNIATHYNILTFFFSDGMSSLRLAEESSSTQRIECVNSKQDRSGLLVTELIASKEVQRPTADTLAGDIAVPVWISNPQAGSPLRGSTTRIPNPNGTQPQTKNSKKRPKQRPTVTANTNSTLTVTIKDMEERGNVTYYLIEVCL